MSEVRRGERFDRWANGRLGRGTKAKTKGPAAAQALRAYTHNTTLGANRGDRQSLATNALTVNAGGRIVYATANPRADESARTYRPSFSSLRTRWRRPARPPLAPQPCCHLNPIAQNNPSSTAPVRTRSCHSSVISHTLHLAQALKPSARPRVSRRQAACAPVRPLARHRPQRRNPAAPRPRPRFSSGRASRSARRGARRAAGGAWDGAGGRAGRGQVPFRGGAVEDLVW